MRTVLIVALLTSVLSIPAWADEKPAASAQSTEQVLADFRTDLQAKRADLMAKNVTLSAAEAAKFWPLFEQFQKEQNAIIDEQLAGIQEYADSYATLSDEDSLALIDAQLARDAKMHALRVKWLARFREILPTRTAARVIQIDRRLGQITQVLISDKIPLIR
ncbi:MAG: hypothetical protein ACREVZ_14570 [Burkholderiales bacterium]